MAKKMTEEEASEVIAMGNKMTKFFEEQKELNEKLLKKYGDSVHYLEHRSTEHPYIKVVISDNLAKVNEGLEHWNHTPFKPVSISTTPLKRKPKDMD